MFSATLFGDEPQSRVHQYEYFTANQFKRVIIICHVSIRNISLVIIHCHIREILCRKKIC